MNLKKIVMKEQSKTLKQLNRQSVYMKQHIADNMIRKMDQQIPAIRDYNQKHPRDLQLVPCDKIHKLMV